jgi:hypothetical protein
LESYAKELPVEELVFSAHQSQVDVHLWKPRWEFSVEEVLGTRDQDYQQAQAIQPSLKINLSTVKKVSLCRLESYQFASDSVQDMFIRGHVYQLLVPQLVSLYYEVKQTPRRRFWMCTLTDSLSSCRNTLERLHIDYPFKKIHDSHKVSLQSFVNLRHLEIPVVLKSPLAESLPPNVELLVIRDDQEMSYADTERIRTFAEVTRCVLGRPKRVIYSYYNHYCSVIGHDLEPKDVADGVEFEMIPDSHPDYDLRNCTYEFRRISR